MAACSAKALCLFQRTLGRGLPRGCPCPCPVPTAGRPCQLWAKAEGAGLRGILTARPGDFRTCPRALCLCPQDRLSSSMKTCYKYLNQTSRSFAAVIQALDEELR